MDKRLESLDLNLLLTLHWLLTERNVTAAAEKVGLSQPATSRALGRLREVFDDPLLVKTGGEMAPTRLADKLQPVIAHAIERCRDVLRVSDEFDPAQQAGLFRIACSDYLGVFAAAAWSSAIQPVAPNLSLEIISPRYDQAPELVTGKLDMCILPDVSVLDLPPTIDPDQFVQKQIMKQDWVCAIRRKHPLAGRPIDLDAFLSLDHILVAPEGNKPGIVDNSLAQLGRKRRITYRTESYLLAVPVAKVTDCVVTGPRALLQMRAGSLYMFAPPFPIQTFDICTVWHPNWTHDARHQWIRNKLFEEMAHLSGCPFAQAAYEEMLALSA